MGAVSIVLGSCAAKKPPPPPPGPAEVGVVVVRSEPVAIRTQLSARTSPYAVSEVRPQVAGIVQRRLFEEGSVVRAGQVLYQIDAAPYAASVAQAAASLQSARARAVSARPESRGDSHGRADLIQSAGWMEAGMDGQAVIDGSAVESLGRG